MIAVVTPHLYEFKRLYLLPRDKFVWVRRTDDVRGRRFEGIIIMHSHGMEKVLDVLECNHPEFFTQTRKI